MERAHVEGFANRVSYENQSIVEEETKYLRRNRKMLIPS